MGLSDMQAVCIHKYYVSIWELNHAGITMIELAWFIVHLPRSHNCHYMLCRSRSQAFHLQDLLPNWAAVMSTQSHAKSPVLIGDIL